nr:MAG TPA: hypothetical protein [Caudoviricetes sp.]
MKCLASTYCVSSSGAHQFAPLDTHRRTAISLFFVTLASSLMKAAPGVSGLVPAFAISYLSFNVILFFNFKIRMFVMLFSYHIANIRISLI